MKQKLLSFFTLLAFVLSLSPPPARAADDSPPSSGNTVYVAGFVGNDNNSGTKDEPVYTLQKALELAGTGGNVIVMNVVTIQPNQFYGVSGDAVLTIDHVTIKRGDGYYGRLIDILGDADKPTTVILGEDVIIDGNSSDPTALEDSELFHIGAYGKLEITENAVLQNNRSTAVVLNTLNNIYPDEAAPTLVMSGGKIWNNECQNDPTAVKVRSRAHFTMNGGEICENTQSASDEPCIDVSGTFEMNGGKIYNNENYFFPCIYVWDNASFTMTKGEISNNFSYGYGAIMNYGTATINGGTISGNTGYGGGIFNYLGNATISGDTVISNNSSPYYGGGAVNFGGTMKISGDAVISGNEATPYIYDDEGNETSMGGGIYNDVNAVLTIEGGTISGNKALFGAGIFNGTGSVIFKDGTISDNQADESGGGVYNSDIFTMTGGTVTNNTAEVYGGGLCTHYTTNNNNIISIEGGTIQGNTAPLGGRDLLAAYGEIRWSGSPLLEHVELWDSMEGDTAVIHIADGFSPQGKVTFDFDIADNKPYGNGQVLAIYTGSEKPKPEYFDCSCEGYAVDADGQNIVLVQGVEVTFDSQDGSEPVVKTVVTGKTVEKPADPERDGYHFKGWFTDAACTEGNKFDFDTGVNEEITLYAKWDIAVSGVALDKTELNLTEGETGTLTAAVSPDDAALKSVSWASSDTDIATVDANGKVTAVKAGTAVITVTTTDGGKTAECAVTVTEKAAEHVHAWSPGWSRNSSAHWHDCTADGCGVTSNAQKDGYGTHTYSSSTDTTCDVCGYVRTVTPPAPPAHSHVWSSAWSTNSGYHWRACTASGCGLTSSSQMYRYEAHSYDDDADPDCNVCGYVREIAPPVHSHVWASTWSFDSASHWHACTADGCGLTENSDMDGYDAHSYDDDSDTDCNVCGYERTVTPPDPGPGDEHSHVWAEEWSFNRSGHWHECIADGCGLTENSDMDGYGAHSYDDDFDTDCNVCGYERDVTLPEPVHEHEWAEEWSFNNTSHWHECIAGGCGLTENSDMDGYDVHSYSGPNDTDCAVCGYEWIVLPEPDVHAEDGEIFQLIMETGVPEVPEELEEAEDLNTPEKIESAMKTAVTEINSDIPQGNTAVYDVVLMVSMDDGVTWSEASAENFPAEGLTVTLPYPAGTNSSYLFTVVHMFTTSAFGHVPGSTETPAVTNTADGIQFTVTGLSPVSVGWEKPGTPSSPSSPSRPSSGNSSSSSVKTYDVTVEKTAHGTVTANRSRASSGTAVTLTAVPDSGYVLDSLTVTDSQGNKIALSEKNTFVMPARDVTVTASFAPVPAEDADQASQPCDGGADCPSRAYPDLNTGSWYHEAVDYAITEGLLTGYSSGEFRPNASLSRAMLAQILYNKEGRPAVSASSRFTDTASGSWYADAVAWAAERGIITGYSDGRFAPNDAITREQLAVMLWRYTGSPAAASRELHFADADQAHQYAFDALCWAAESGVLNGKGNGTLDPAGLTSRAETAQMFFNLFNK